MRRGFHWHRAPFIVACAILPLSGVRPTFGSDGLYALEISGATPTPTPTPTPVPSAGACAGDCDQSGVVILGEVVLLVSIVLRDLGVDGCPAGDLDGNGSAEVFEVVAAVSRLLNGCSDPPPTPTPDPLAATGACYESSNCFPCDVHPCAPFAASRSHCCHLARTIVGATFSWCPDDAFDAGSASCTQCAFPCP